MHIRVSVLDILLLSRRVDDGEMNNLKEGKNCARVCVCNLGSAKEMHLSRSVQGLEVNLDQHS